MSRGSSSFGGLGRSHIGSNIPSQQLTYRGTSPLRYSASPNYTFAYRAGQAPDRSAGRYGSGARPNRTNSREAERRERSESRRSGRTNVRTTPAGPQEAEDWADALDRSSNSLETVERLVRSHAQTLANISVRLGTRKERLKMR